jgi:hypothetical protein
VARRPTATVIQEDFESLEGRASKTEQKKLYNVWQLWVNNWPHYPLSKFKTSC